MVSLVAREYKYYFFSHCLCFFTNIHEDFFLISEIVALILQMDFFRLRLPQNRIIWEYHHRVFFNEMLLSYFFLICLYGIFLGTNIWHEKFFLSFWDVALILQTELLFLSKTFTNRNIWESHHKDLVTYFNSPAVLNLSFGSVSSAAFFVT